MNEVDEQGRVRANDVYRNLTKNITFYSYLNVYFLIYNFVKYLPALYCLFNWELILPVILLALTIIYPLFLLSQG